MITARWMAFLLTDHVIATFLLLSVSAQDANWTHFRGSNLDGISTEVNVPVHWSDSTHIRWKTPVHGKGWSSPVIFEDQIWITSAEEDGSGMYGICFDKNSGKILFDKKLIDPDTVFAKYTLNSYATPTPCIESGFVYLHFGNYGTFCLKTEDASLIWKSKDFSCDYIQGPASSLILYKDLLISNGSAVCIAYDPATGEEIWRIVHGEDSTIAMPFFENGIVYFYSSFITPPSGEKFAELFAVNPDGRGNIKESHVIWRYQSPILQLLTPLIKDGLIYTIDTRSNLICLDAKSGNIVWSEKMKGVFNSSPVYAGGHLYFSTTKGITVVIKEGRKPEFLAENKLKGEIWATPAILDKSIFIRTSDYFYRISE
jgi:outer membrane protein assembly factor BamB